MRTGYFTVLGDLQSYVDLASLWTSQVCSLAAFSSGVHLGKKKSKGKKTTVETSLACRFLDGHADSAGDKPGL